MKRLLLFANSVIKQCDTDYKTTFYSVILRSYFAVLIFALCSLVMLHVTNLPKICELRKMYNKDIRPLS